MSKRSIPRCTLAAPAGPVRGVGVRSGRNITVTLRPANSGQGLAIRRSDLGVEYPLHLDNALNLPTCTAVGTSPQDATLFVEHLMAVLHVHRITDLVLELDGPEIPLLDGSAAPWNALVRQAGTRELEGSVEPVVVSENVRLGEGDRWIEARPADAATFCFDLQYDHPMIRCEIARFSMDADGFARMLAPARTFALKEELDAAVAAGELKAGTEENCRIIYQDRVSEPATLPDELARHKVLDMLGDLYLLGRPVIGEIHGYRTGHAQNRELLRALSQVK
ncbi:MAG: UDP-3-O-[3-hydroxymyristoyl] N-acetylglucosamine deacetylase [Armatimonadetes bacterium]|nr:UDP-3-O-[3-hydroxymyristoyl] N-acetylglucosamine deacetylase [Armatimonadota bacterium]